MVSCILVAAGGVLVSILAQVWIAPHYCPPTTGLDMQVRSPRTPMPWAH